MNDIINISRSNVSILKFTSPGKFHPRSISSSEDGFIAILHLDCLLIGTIGFQPLSDDTKYVLTKELVEVDFKNTTAVIKVADFDFIDAINEKKIADNVIYEMMLNVNYTTENNGVVSEISRIEWSPLDPIVNKSFLGVMGFDGRIIILGQNKNTNIWEKEYDLLDLYHQFYKNNFMKSCAYDSEGCVLCNDFKEYINLKTDLKPISFSWSLLVRQSKQSQYFLIALLTKSGLISLWRITNDQVSSRCEAIHHFRLNFTQSSQPKLIQFCDLTSEDLVLSVIYSDEQIVGYPFRITIGDESGDDIIITELGDKSIIDINHQSKFSQASKLLWSVKYQTLIVGYESELLFSRLDMTLDTGTTTNHWLELPSTEEISGIVVKHNVAYVTSRDGYLFGIKLETSMDSLEMNEIMFEDILPNATEFVDVFVSPNGVHLGFILKNIDCANKQDKKSNDCSSDIVLVRMMLEKDVLSILLDDNKPFSRKQDAVEEMRQLYFNNKHLLHSALQKLAKNEAHWEGSTLHNLQLARYFCMFFGYQLNVNHEFGPSASPSGVRRNNDMKYIRHLESIIVSRNISYWLDGFSDLSSDVEVTQGDCFFVLSLCAKLRRGSPTSDILEAVEAAQSKAHSLLVDEFHVQEEEIRQFETKASRLVCPVCEELCEFNLFVSKCSNNHLIPRCCKTLELCTNFVKRCKMCGATEKFIETIGLSNWRVEIVNSNCPLCDGKFVKLKF